MRAVDLVRDVHPSFLRAFDKQSAQESIKNPPLFSSSEKEREISSHAELVSASALDIAYKIPKLIADDNNCPQPSAKLPHRRLSKPPKISCHCLVVVELVETTRIFVSLPGLTRQSFISRCRQEPFSFLLTGCQQGSSRRFPQVLCTESDLRARNQR